jgi:hypothetical protein
VEELTALVLTVNVALVLPAATVTLAGTVATAVLLLASVTSAPPLGAARFSFIVPWAELPPVTVAGFRVKDESFGRGAAFACCELQGDASKEQNVSTTKGNLPRPCVAPLRISARRVN